MSTDLVVELTAIIVIEYFLDEVIQFRLVCHDGCWSVYEHLSINMPKTRVKFTSDELLSVRYINICQTDFR